MARFPEAEARLFANVYVCMNCSAKIRAGKGHKPDKCRKCNSKRLRAKNKIVKKGGK